MIFSTSLNYGLILSITVLICGCNSDVIYGEGEIITETRDLGAFSYITSDFPGDIYFSEGPSFKMEISAYENLLPLIETSVEEHILVIKYHENSNINTDRQTVVNIQAPKITGFVINGSGDIYTEGPIKGDILQCFLSGSGNFTIAELRTEVADLQIEGSGDILVKSGKVDQMNAMIYGSGNIGVSHVKARNAKVDIEGSGNAVLNVEEHITVFMDGSGDLHYHGNPEIDEFRSGSGNIIKL